MVDSTAVAIAYSVQELEENMLGQNVITNILTKFRNIVEEIALWAIFQNNENAVRFVDNFQHTHHVGVG